MAPHTDRGGMHCSPHLLGRWGGRGMAPPYRPVGHARLPHTDRGEQAWLPHIDRAGMHGAPTPTGGHAWLHHSDRGRGEGCGMAPYAAPELGK